MAGTIKQRRLPRDKKRTILRNEPSLIAKLKKKGGQFLRLLRLTALLASIVAISYFFLGRDGYLRCRSLTINGLKTLRRDQVVQNLPPILGENMLLLGLDNIQKRLEEMQIIEKASVSRIFPDKLQITVFERVPMAVAVVKEDCWAVDHDGVVLYPFNSSQIKDPIFITGFSANDEENSSKIKWAVHLIKRLRDSGKNAATVSEINVADIETVKLFAFSKGTEIRLDRSYYQKTKWDYLINFLSRRSFTPEKLAYLDLRHRDVVIRPL